MPVGRLHEPVPLFCLKFTLVPAIAAGNDHPTRRNDFNLAASWAASELDQIFENSDSKLLTLAKDVLALTTVNWNTTQFDQSFWLRSKQRGKSGAFSSTSTLEHQCRRISGYT
jgi:hypothetical protein